MRYSRVTVISAARAAASMSPPSRVRSLNRLSPQLSCTRWRLPCMPPTASTTASSSSNSICTASVMSSAAARDGAMQAAIASPTYRTLSVASGGQGGDFAPAACVTTRIGFSRGRSAAVKTRPRCSGGISIDLIRACACGLRRNATSMVPGSRMSDTNSPRPRRWRSSSLRSNEAPRPYWLRVVCIRRVLPLCRHDGGRHEPSYGRRAVCLVAMLLVEQRQVDRVAQLAVAAIARMQPVAAIVDRAHLGRDLGIAQRRIEIGDAVERAAVADPLIDGDAMPLARRVPRIRHEGLVAERGQRRADDLDAGGVRPHRHLLQPGDHLLAGDLLLGIGPAVAQIVGAEHDDDMRDAGRRQHVAV